ncbi:transcriptional regulator OPI1 [Kluyveromyces lactis]|uniref:KLLA0F25388p n=1 Tax=Kluyveromyces lactis (strain ATCC 8585 / CBS 2359 / DSM 70799 / NBRC 1267 / NRRL Y-1140 / WM37) TaxID=284590 RepID=Q6CIM8_KLULA|nr:uncharacterized protein KLLA0_F25388g [Kluyveromyces lactis]CAG98919.1 KLLA0F25388p [Kluyveromyces lactis]|eukprot:XP_456211.1 uncharacterized protein KLLA0_F25388g [Kluyveromyces lactis]
MSEDRGNQSTIKFTVSKDSEEIAVEALDKLRNGDYSVTPSGSESSGKSERLLDKMKQSAVDLYEQTRTNHPKLIRRADRLVKKIEKTSGIWIGAAKRKIDEVDTQSNGDDDDSDDACVHGLDIEHIKVQGKEICVTGKERGSKRRRIKENLKEYQLNMSIESKKRLMTCLGLLKLANKQLSQRVMSLQDVVKKEQLRRRSPLPISSSIDAEVRPRNHCSVRETTSSAEHPGHDRDEEEDEQFFDASSQLNEQAGNRKQDDTNKEQEDLDIDAAANDIQLEVVGTLKKVYSVVSRFTGNSLPEPARSQVRESLLKLPTKWMINSEKPNSKRISSNKRALLLAQEALDMVGNVMNVVDGTLGKAEEWVKNKQELKQMLMEQFRHEQLKQQVKHQLTKESASSTPSNA